MAFSGPSVTFCFGSDSRVTLSESLLSSLPAGGITFGSFTDSAYVTLGGPTPSEAAAFSPPQRRGRAAMRPFGRPVARQPARAIVRPLPVRAQPVRPVARQPVPRPLPVQPVHTVVRRPAPTVPVVRPAPAPQRRQPVVPLVVVPVEATRARVSPPPSSSRKRGAQAELPSPSSRRVSVFARLSHSETARQTPVTYVVAPVPPVVQSVGPDVASSSTSGLGRRAKRNRNRRLRLAASEAAVQEMIVSVAQQEPVQRRVVPSQREPRRPTVVRTPDVVVAPEIDAVQGGRFSPLVHSGDEEDAGRIAAAPPVTTTLPRARVPRDGAARALTQRIRSIVRSARGRGRVSEERLLREISQVHLQLQRQSVRQSYQWRRGQPPRQSTRPVVTAKPLTDAPSVGRRPRRHGRRPPSEPVRSQLGSVVVVPPPQSDVPSTSRRSRWVWRRRQVDQPVEIEQTVGTVRRVDTVVPSVAAAVPMICDRAADDEFVPSVSPPVRVESAGVSDQQGVSSPMGPHIDALCQTFSEDDWLGEESEEDVPVHRVCVVTRRGMSDEHRDIDDDMEEQGEADVPSTSAQGGPPRSVDTDATVLQLQSQMAEMARAMATMTAQLTALGVAPQVMEVGTPTTSRDEPVVPPVVVPDPVRVDRVQRTVPAVPPTVTFSTPVQTQSVQMSPGQIQDMITQKDSIPSAVPPKVESQPLRRPQRQEFSGAPPPPRKADVHNTYEVQDKGKRPMVSSAPQRPPPPPRPQFPPRPQLPPQAPAQSSGQFQPRPPVQQFRPPLRTPEKQQFLQEKLSKEYPFKRESVKKIFKFLVKKNILAFPTNRKVEEEGQTEHPLYCPFHRHIGHVIEDCYVFKDRVESLMANGEIHLQDSDLVQPRGKVAQIVQMITGSEQCGSQHSSQSSDSGEPLSSGEEWQLALSRKTRGMIRQAVQSSEAVERRPPQAKSTVASTFTLPVSSSPSSVVVPTEHISPSSCIKKMYEREKLVVTSEGKTGSLPALTLKDFVLPPIDDELMEEDDSGYFWSLSVPSSSRSRTRSFHVLSISDDDVVSLHEEEFECDELVFTIPEGGCYMDSGDESESTPQPLLVEVTQAMTLEPNESPDEFDLIQEIQLRSGKIMLDLLFQFAVGHDVPPSRVRRHLIPEGGLVIGDGSDDDVDVGRQDTSRQSFPHPRYGMRVEGSSQQPSPIPPATSVRGPLYSDSPSVHELHTLYVPPRSGWHASLFHSVGVPQSTDTPGFVESTVDDEITLAPRLSSPFVDGCVERGLVPTTWTDGQARQQARVWRTDLPQTTRGLGQALDFWETPCILFSNLVKYASSRSLFTIFELGQVNIELFPFAVFEVGQANVEFPLFGWVPDRVSGRHTSPPLHSPCLLSCLGVVELFLLFVSPSSNLVRRTLSRLIHRFRTWSSEW
ncbi:hypothetical protein M5K25_008043 [Dendrobium thyrsiflorum]|uniref:Uncharacterized protein n=1 Tax=Dendrobium thyrsiflorum TaxID=117978 RepID=A0ABD0V7T7_DENTH